VVRRAPLALGGGRRLPALVAAAATVATAAALPAVARACTVCYGAADDAMIDGTRLSVVFLLGLTYLLLGGGVGMFLLSRRHHRNAAARTIDTHRGADAP
jgi:hypothetical protein